MTASVFPELKVMLLTGCAGGIGRHLAAVFAAQGHRLIMTDIQPITPEESWNSERVMLRQLDVCDYSAWEQAVNLAVQRWGRLDVMINLAAVLHPGYILDLTPEQIAQHINVNVTGTLYGTHAAAAQMKQQPGGGHIINFASLAALAPIPGIAAYSASKHAVRGFSLAAVIEFKKYGIAVTTISPDAVQTPMLDLELQNDAAALTFSGFGILSVEDVEKAVMKALRKKPLEMTIPRHRGWTAKIAGIFPGIGMLLEPILTRLGRRTQNRLRSRR
ncbi:MAG TPA: SDR family oxidoreductase [Aggregatilineales bacterium]|nr:SDR family oxidoreductase [Aggregatilineales bacterium]